MSLMLLLRLYVTCMLKRLLNINESNEKVNLMEARLRLH
jgi:hypothetical protein